MRGKFFIVAPIIGLKSIIDLFGPLGLYSWQRAFINVVIIKHRSKFAEVGGNWSKKWILELYLVKFTLKFKFLQVWSLAIQEPQ